MTKVAVMLANGFEEIEALTVVDVLRRAAIQSLKEAHEQGKSLAAICAAPIVLDRAGLLDEKSYTCYDGFEKEIGREHYVKEAVVQDGHILTSRGPATALAFSYALVNHFGGDATALREGMLYQDVFGTSAP